MCFQSVQEQSTYKLPNYCHGKQIPSFMRETGDIIYSFYLPLLFKSFLSLALISHQHFLIPNFFGLSVPSLHDFSFHSSLYYYSFLLFISVLPLFHPDSLMNINSLWTTVGALSKAIQDLEHHGQLSVVLVQNVSAAMNEHKSSFLRS